MHFNTYFVSLTLLMIQEAFVDSVDQDQTAENCSLISDLHCPHFHSS